MQYNNECTKVQNPRYKCVTLKAYTSARTKTQPKIYYNLYN